MPPFIPPHICKIRRFLFFLVATGFLSVVLVACAGGGGSSSSSGGSSSSSSPRIFEVNLTFTPMSGGFRIANQSDFGNFISLNITATSENGSVVEERNINITEFVDDSYYDFTGLNDQSDWMFIIRGMLSDGSQQDVRIDFTWQENREDHTSGGIRAGLNTDGDARADSVDEDADGDGRDDIDDNCPLVANPAQTNTDLADDGGDACDGDDDNDGLDDVDEPSGCELDSDCDDDGLDDGDEPAGCVLDSDCDDDGARDGDEEAGCVQNTDCDTDGVGDGIEARGCARLKDCDSDGAMDRTDIDDDGDGLIEIANETELDAVRHQLDGTGRRLLAGATLNQTGCGDGTDITSCSGYELVADISLLSYASADGGKGWLPLAHDTSLIGLCQGTAFSGTFEGNGWTISDLNINRSREDCVGLFGNIAVDATIRNLTIHAETVIGIHTVGGLVAWGQNATIISSSVVAAEVSGRDFVGGLVGDGLGAKIISSSVVAAEVSGSNNVGGLVGDGTSAQIHSSSVVAADVSGGQSVGGLVGLGRGVRIFSSSVVLNEAQGNGNNVGGLVGLGSGARIFSSSVVVGEMDGRISVGGLVGSGPSIRIFSSSVVVDEISGVGDPAGLAGDFRSGRVAYSYVVSGSRTNMLVASGSGNGNASYWDSGTSGVTSGNHGQPKTSNELRMPTDYAAIYANWTKDMDIFGDEDEPLAVWCDKDNSGNITAGERTDENRIWDFGTSSQYPAIRCTPIGPDEWRDWWSLDGSGDPAINQARLDALLP